MKPYQKAFLTLSILAAAVVAYARYADYRAGPNAGLEAALSYGILSVLAIFFGLICLLVFSTTTLSDTLKELKERKASGTTASAADILKIVVLAALLIVSLYPFVYAVAAALLH